jgi:hypothetical protein
MAEGATYTGAWDGLLRNDTPPGHVSMATGTLPRNSGVIGFHWRDPATGEVFKPTSWYGVAAGQLNQVVDRSGCTSIGTEYKRAFPGAKVAALSSDKFYAAAALGANSADYIGYCLYDPQNGYGTEVGYRLVPRGVTPRMPPEAVMNDPRLDRVMVNPWDGDTWTTDFAVALFERERPEILLINLAHTDNAGHLSGGISSPAEMAPVIANVDAQIGRLMEAYRRAGIYDQTVWVVTADHAMSANRNTIDESPMAQIVANYGLEKSAARTEYYIDDPSMAAEVAEKIAQLKLAGVHAVHYKVVRSGGGFAYLPAPTTAAGIDTGLDAAYRYLTSTYASPQSADIVLFPAEHWNTSESTGYFEGDHGTATWQNQHIPLVFSGPGIRQGAGSTAPARLVDIGPTVLAAMGLAPGRMDGVALADALESPTAAQRAAQQAANAELTPLRDALRSRSIADTRRRQITEFTFSRDYEPGTRDANGQMLAGSELMRIVAHKGELFASTSTFTDPRLYTGDPAYPGCQVLRKTSSRSGWQVDISFGRRYLRTDTLEVVRFTQNTDGSPLTEPVEMLVAGIWDIGALLPGGERYITLAVRDDATGQWTLSRVASVPTTEKGFASVRAVKVHRDQVTGREYLFVGAANGGMFKGVYDPTAPGRIRWIGGDEVDATYGRVHSMCIANGSLYASFDYGGLTVQNQGGGVYRRIDGAAPIWERVYHNYDPKYPTWNQTDRGITAVPAEDGSGKEVILVGVEWPPAPVIVRIEPHNDHRAVVELDYNAYFTDVFGRPPQILGGSKEYPHAGVQAAALNYFEPFVDPNTGETDHFVTLFLIHPDDPAEGKNGAYFLVRREPGVYDWGEIPSGLPAGAHLRGTRTVERSPFPEEPHTWYFGGCFIGPDEQPPKPDLAWIYKATWGASTGATATPTASATPAPGTTPTVAPSATTTPGHVGRAVIHLPVALRNGGW